jgi:hypothetical protein
VRRVDRSQVIGIQCGVVGGAEVYDPIGNHRESQGHGAEGVGQ